MAQQRPCCSSKIRGKPHEVPLDPSPSPARLSEFRLLGGGERFGELSPQKSKQRGTVDGMHDCLGQGAAAATPQTHGLSCRKLFLPVLEAEKPKIKVLSDSVPAKSSFLASGWSASCCVLTWQREREREKERGEGGRGQANSSVSSSSYKGTSPIWELTLMTSSKPDYIPKAPYHNIGG